jgi:hypothetical protein
MYRDERETCPRCSADLIDAGSGRACVGCAGQWIDLEIVQEMALTMQVPAGPLDLPWQEVARDPIACPVCDENMRTMTLYSVPIDMCGKHHGVWFDAHELALVLMRSVRPSG